MPMPTPNGQSTTLRSHKLRQEIAIYALLSSFKQRKKQSFTNFAAENQKQKEIR